MPKIICNKANDEKCPKGECEHRDPHIYPSNYDMQCTKWGICLDENIQIIFKVRCVSVESKQGKNIIEELQGKEGVKYG